MKPLLFVVSSLVLISPTPAAEPADPAALRARAALALAFAVPTPPSYAEAYTTAVDARKPLVVFVGQPARELPGCVCVGMNTFPDAAKEAVVVGTPAGRALRRVDLPGTPTDAAIRAAVGAGPATTAVLPPTARCDGTTRCAPDPARTAR